ncbi:MAG: hypothetical protein WCF26_07750 [Candidatus Sulfotelmatobacter sp.]
MFDLLPDNSYSRKAVWLGIIFSLSFVATGVFGVVRGQRLDVTLQVVLGVAMLVVWGSRRHEVPKSQGAGPMSDSQGERSAR